MSDGPPCLEDQAILLEQYKAYLQMADNSSERRSKTNAYYVSVTAAILVLAARFEWLAPESGVQAVGLLLIGALGLLVCWIWRANVRSFQQLSQAKFQVIHELEQRLPFPCFEREWEVLQKVRKGKQYLQLTKVEMVLPLALTIPYLILMLIAISFLMAGG